MAATARWQLDARMKFLAGSWSHTNYKIALYSKACPEDMSAYTPINEIKAVGYRAGGAGVDKPTVAQEKQLAVLKFSGQARWTGDSISARYGCIYNTSGVLVTFDLGELVTSTNDLYKIDLSTFSIAL